MSILDFVYFAIHTFTFIYAYNTLKNDSSVTQILPILFITLVIHVVAEVLKVNRINNLFLYHLLIPIQYCFYSDLFIKNLNNKTFRLFIKISVGFVILMSIFFALFIEGIYKNNSYSSVISSLLLTSWSVLYLVQLVQNEVIVSFIRIPFFWVAIGLILNSIGNIFINGSLNFLMARNMKLAGIVYNFSYIFDFIFFISVVGAGLFKRNELSLKNELQ